MRKKIYEYQVPINNENEIIKHQELQQIQEKKDPLIIDSSHIKALENNNTINTLNNSSNTNKNIITDSIKNIP